MKITRIELENIKCFEKATIDLSPNINIFIGQNNHGKSTLLNCIAALQIPFEIPQSYKRSQDLHSSATLFFDALPISRNPNHQARRIQIYPETNKWSIQLTNGGNLDAGNDNRYQNIEPKTILIPYFSKRKVQGYSEMISLAQVNTVSGDLTNLYAKIDRISNPEFLPAYGEYIEACDKILGFRVSAVSSGSGKKGAYTIKNERHIPIDSMGEGVASLLGLIVDLCRTENKLYLIEEPENDIHPKALKALLKLIATKSQTNQFIITTHSNIVVRELASIETTNLFNVKMTLIDRIPTSTIRHITSPDDRRQALEDLGYELFDFDLWKFWLFLEESSAESIIRDWLIPWFFPKIKNHVRAFSTGGAGKITRKFEDFNSLFVYLHLTPTYKNKACVLIDGGAEETKIIEKLRETYGKSGWNPECFCQLEQHDFERYYPSRFANEVESALTDSDKQERRNKKDALVKNVISWIEENEALARAEFEDSAKPVIEKLQIIFSQSGLL